MELTGVKKLKLNREVQIQFEFDGETLEFYLNQITEKTIQLISVDGTRFNFNRETGNLRGGKGRIVNSQFKVLSMKFEGSILVPCYKVTELGIKFIER